MSDDSTDAHHSVRDVAAFGDDAAMLQYKWLSSYEDYNRLQTQTAYSNAIDLWQRALEIRSRPFPPGTTIPYDAPTDTIDQKLTYMSYDYRLEQSILSLGTSKVTLDACLGGYYSQALALCRNMLEAFKRMAFARRSPLDAYRWYPREWFADDLVAAIGDRYTPKPPDGNDWKRIFPDVPEPMIADLLDLGFNQAVNLHLAELNPHVHPTPLGSRQQQRGPGRGLLVHPGFDADTAYWVLREGSVAEFFLMYELAWLILPNDQWTTDVQRWREDYLEEFGSTQLSPFEPFVENPNTYAPIVRAAQPPRRCFLPRRADSPTGHGPDPWRQRVR